MLVSWEWLSDYVDIGIGHEEMATRWALTGLNHESTVMVDGVPVIDLEITSNRGDCLRFRRSPRAALSRDLTQTRDESGRDSSPAVCSDPRLAIPRRPLPRPTHSGERPGPRPGW